MARALRCLMEGLAHGVDTAELHRLQDGIGLSLVRLSTLNAEAQQERAVRLVATPDTAPLTRTLLRLRHDLVMIGRAVQLPLPETLSMRLRGPLDRVATSVADYLAASGAALRERSEPASMTDTSAALGDLAKEIASVRLDGGTRVLTIDAAERFFALCFAFEQLRKNLDDLERCVREWAEPRNSGGRSKT